MTGGYQQGCEFVTSRCGIGFDDRSALPSSSSECRGDPFWGASPDEYLTSKCSGGSTPCDSLRGSGFSAAGSSLRCNAQCHSGSAARSDCTAAPTAQLEGSGTPSLFGYQLNGHYTQ